MTKFNIVKAVVLRPALAYRLKTTKNKKELAPERCGLPSESILAIHDLLSAETRAERYLGLSAALANDTGDLGRNAIGDSKIDEIIRVLRLEHHERALAAVPDVVALL